MSPVVSYTCIPASIIFPFFSFLFVFVFVFFLHLLSNLWPTYFACQRKADFEINYRKVTGLKVRNSPMAIVILVDQQF